MKSVFRSSLQGLALGFLLFLPACAGGGSPTGETSSAPIEFDFSTSEAMPVAIEVTLDGLPAEGAIVQVMDALRVSPGAPIEESIGGCHHFTGRVQVDGFVRGELRLPSTTTEVDVVVTLPGATGPVDEAELLTLWGPFAPAARVHAAPNQLDSLTLALTEATQ